MSNDLLPESIRGGWYWMPEDYEDEEENEIEDELVLFRLDETFERLEREDGSFEVSESGDYTFDGQFLINRGTQTSTFRVHPHTPRHWELEGKRETRHLLRGRSGADASATLSEERRAAIERLPMQVLVRSRYDLAERGEFADFVHEPRSGESRVVAHLYAEPVRDGRLWLLLTPLVDSLEPELWRTIVEKSYLDVHLDAPDDIERVEMAWATRSGASMFEYEA
jgi:hypothetical protein